MADTIVRLNFPNSPVELAESFVGEARKFNAVFVAGVDREGKLFWDGACMRKGDLLWALERMKHELLDGKLPMESARA